MVLFVRQTSIQMALINRLSHMNFDWEKRRASTPYACLFPIFCRFYQDITPNICEEFMEKHVSDLNCVLNEAWRTRFFPNESNHKCVQIVGKFMAFKWICHFIHKNIRQTWTFRWLYKSKSFQWDGLPFRAGTSVGPSSNRHSIWAVWRQEKP